MKTSLNRIIATVFGVIFLLVGALGFLVTSNVGFIASDGESLLGFEVNPLHNIVHLLIGAVLLYAGLKSTLMAKRANTTVGAVYLLVGIIGLFITGIPEFNILALNSADNVLHFISAAVLLIAGLVLDRDTETGVIESTATHPPETTGSSADPAVP